ncbi:methyltransferase family protein [Flavobacterium sp.]|uniref:methyltransferase family protein n=1 Tax=Flavobacterium sp. TaxID=239 RepID=UPI0038FC8697
MALQEELEQQGIWLFKYRGKLPTIVLLIGAILYFQTKINPEIFCLEETPYEIYYELFCLLVSLLGLSIRIYTVGHTPKNTSGRNRNEQIADTLNTSGSYSVVRHPLYLGNFFMWMGPALLTANFWFLIAFCFFYWIYYERIMFAEEQFLRRKFSAIYTDWAQTLPAFVPSFKKYKKPELPFSWIKIIKKEINGIAGIFIIFSIFDISGHLIQNQNNYNYFIIVTAVFLLVFNLVMRFLKKKTTLLNGMGD